MNPDFGPVSTISVTADGDVTATVSLIHLGVGDTVTLRDGFRQTSVVDVSVAPVAGNSWEGRATLTASGTLHSEAAGGSVELTTPTAFVSYGEDAYPRAGVLHLDGAASALQATALSTSAVQLDLDANDDGTWESTETVDWDWLV